jgi:biopolymer transport protein TolQ
VAIALNYSKKNGKFFSVEDMTPETSILSMVTGSGPVVFGVLIMLVALSLWSWTITVSKALEFKKAKQDSDRFRSLFWETKNLSKIDSACSELAASPLVQVFGAGYKELSELINERTAMQQRGDQVRSEHSKAAELGTLEMALRRAEYDQTVKLENGVTFLATVASAAPFIGLFGTVWGIMNAFHGLSSMQSTTLQAVAPGISEALIATAIGLAAAIPAAVAFNYFTVSIKYFKTSMHRFSEEFLNVAERYIV